MSGGLGIDTLSFIDSAAGVTADLTLIALSGSATVADDVVNSDFENIHGSAVGGDTLTGDGFANWLVGNGGNDALSGAAGLDVLLGRDGQDVPRGGTGADLLDGGAGIDTASYAFGLGAIWVDLSLALAAGGDAQGDTYANIENVTGSSGADTITGNGAANALNGGAGKDTMTGLVGADRFVFSSATHSVVGTDADRITDFSHAQGDRIDLSAIDANTGVAGDQAFSFIGAGLYTGVAGQLRHSVAGGATTVAGDLNGDSTSDFHIVLTGTIGLVAADFVL